MSLVQVHLKERMHALEEKNNLSTELHQTRKKLEELANQKVRIQFIPLKALLRIRIRIRIRRIRFWASWIRTGSGSFYHNCKKNLDSYSFVTSF
jgi:hypothetical protein